MRTDIVLRYVGLVLIILAGFMLLSAGVSLIYRDGAGRVLLYSGLVTLLFGLFPMVFVPASPKISSNEGLVIVVAGWLLSCLFGALPYILWGNEFSFTNAWFESVSGFTTTGSSILTEIESLPHGLLFWRASTHWIGGLGILMFVLSVLPAIGMAGMVLFRIELSPLARDNFRQSARETARILFIVYGGLTLAETIALVAAGMSLFDAVANSFATIATGGFCPRNMSIASYDSVAVEIIIMIFMLLSGVHFGLLFATLEKGKTRFWRSVVFRYYALAMLVGSVWVALSLHMGGDGSWWHSVRVSTFQVLSVGTSTGFATADSSVWPPVAQILLMFFALQCACAGSTSGGIKADRFVLFAKGIRKQFRLAQHPHAILPVRLDGKIITDEAMGAAMLYIGLYLVIVVVGGFLLMATGVDATSAFSGVVATTGNVGPGLGTVGSLENFNAVPSLGKWVLTGTMLLGRLEIYGLIMLLLPSLWRSMGSPVRTEAPASRIPPLEP